jgi:cytochrome b involved in lipid metabolism
MNKQILFITAAVIVMGLLFTILAYVYFEPTTPYISSTGSQDSSSVTSASKESLNPGSINQTSETPQQQLSSKISQSILAEHNSEQDCWVGYNGKAYDITSFLPNHPGGVRAIARNCGTSTQFEDAFRKQHGTSKAGMFIKVAIYKGDLE